MILLLNYNHNILNKMPLTPDMCTINRLQVMASHSVLIHQHAAALMSHGRVLAISFNSLRGITQGHAEVSAIRQYLINRGQYLAAKKLCILWG
jgi:hypothetical protein